MPAAAGEEDLGERHVPLLPGTASTCWQSWASPRVLGRLVLVPAGEGAIAAAAPCRGGCQPHQKATSGVQMMSSMLWGSTCCIVELGLGDAVFGSWGWWRWCSARRAGDPRRGAAPAGDLLAAHSQWMAGRGSSSHRWPDNFMTLAARDAVPEAPDQLLGRRLPLGLAQLFLRWRMSWRRFWRSLGIRMGTLAKVAGYL